MLESRHTNFGLLDVDVESVVRSQNLVYENAATCWQDGHILGNGDMGAVCYAPHWLEWTINKINIFDSRTAPKKRLPHREVMAEVKRRGARDLRFLETIEKPDTRHSPLELLLKSVCQVKVRTRANEYCWGAPHPYKTQQRLSLWGATNTLEPNLLRDYRAVPEDAYRSYHTRVRSFVCWDRNMMVVRLRGASGPLLEHKRLELCRPSDGDYGAPQFGSDGRFVWFVQKVPDGMSYAVVMGATPMTSPQMPPGEGQEQKNRLNARGWSQDNEVQGWHGSGVRKGQL